MKSPFKRILVPLDGSAEAEVVLGAVMPIARAFSSELTLLNVTPHPEQGEEAAKYLAQARDALVAAGIDARFRQCPGRPAEQILAFAADSESDLIAMTTHGRTGLKKMLLGSVTCAVLRRTEVPLFACRPDTPQRPWKRIVVALDGSTRSEEILPDAARLSRGLQARLELVTARMPIVALESMSAIPAYYEPEDPLPYLRVVCDRLVAEGVNAVPVARVGSAAYQIAEHARETEAGLLCLTTHGRTGAGRIFLGSVAEELLHTAPCPLLIRRMAPALSRERRR